MTAVAGPNVVAQPLVQILYELRSGLDGQLTRLLELLEVIDIDRADIKFDIIPEGRIRNSAIARLSVIR